MILTEKQNEILEFFDKIPAESLKRLSEEDRVVDKLKGEVSGSPGLLQRIVYELGSIQQTVHRLEFEKNEMQKDMKKVLNVMEKANGYSLNADYEYQSLKSKYINYY